MSHIDTFKEFTSLALRTESKITTAQINTPVLLTLLNLFVTVGTLLDYTKKGIYYKNYTKYDANYTELVNTMAARLATLQAVEAGDNSRAMNSTLNFRLVHGLLGAVTEASELAEHLIEHIKTGIIDKIGVGEEFSDIDWYKAITFDELILEEPVCRDNVIEKLRVRFPDKYADDAAANRNLEAEHNALKRNI